MIRASLTSLSLRFREECFERWYRGAIDADVDFDHAPEVDGDGVEEGVFGLGVDPDSVESDNRCDATEYS